MLLKTTIFTNFVMLVCLICVFNCVKFDYKTNERNLYSTENLVLNPDFDEPSLSSDSSFYTSIPHWEVLDGEFIEIGIGQMYNSKWGKKQVAELDSVYNYSIIQTINLPEEKKCLFKFNYAANENDILSSGLEAKFNDIVLFSKRSGVDNDIHEMQFEVTALYGDNDIIFSGIGLSDGIGMTLSNIGLYCKNEVQENSTNDITLRVFTEDD